MSSVTGKRRSLARVVIVAAAALSLTFAVGGTAIASPGAATTEISAGYNWESSPEGGSWQGGSWQGGSWQGGSWQGGSWQGGSWQGGSWQGVSPLKGSVV
jgi:uncharacterized membrane protein